MHHVEPKVYLIGKSEPHLGNMNLWLSDLGASASTVDRMLDPIKTDGEVIVEAAGRRCYMSFEVGMNPNVSRIREDIGKYIDNILDSGHGSVTEHVTYTFAIENVSRVFTGEMNRHRAGMAISEGSMRYIRFEDIPYWIPTSIQEVDGDKIPHANGADGLAYTDLGAKKSKSRRVFDEVFEFAQEKYAELNDIWKDELAPESKFHAKKQITSMMRRIIAMGVSSGGVWTGNLRAWRHIMTMRGSAAAEEEIYLVACMIFEELVKAEPNFFKDFTRDENGFLKPKYTKV